MVTDGRFPSAFACLTWKCSPTERLRAPSCRLPRFSPATLIANVLYMLESGTNVSKSDAGNVIEVELR